MTRRRRSSFHSRVDFDRLDPTLENAIYRIAQEALTNACQHSKSDKVHVSLVQRRRSSRIEIRDWGVGSIPRPFRKTTSAWKVSGNGRGCWVGSAASEARLGKALG